jgi:hypothetical protein
LQKIDIEVDALAKKHGTAVTNLSEEQVQEWKLCSESLLEDYLERSGPLGADVLAGYRQLIRESYRTPAPMAARH